MTKVEFEALLLTFAEQAGLKDAGLLRGNERHAPWMRERGLVAGLVGTTRVAGREVSLRVGLPRNFPFDLPVVRLDEAESFPHTPHVEEDGAVCYVIPRGLVVDRHNPLAILHDGLGRAAETLRRGWEEDVADEFMDEFGAYWRHTCPQHSVQAFLRVDDRLRPVQLKMAPQTTRSPRTRGTPSAATAWAEGQAARGRELRRRVLERRLVNPERLPPRPLGWVADTVADTQAFLQQEQTQGRRSALYVPLATGARIQPPRPGERWTALDVRDLVRVNLTPENLEVLDRLARNHGDELLVILALPRPRGGTTLIGLRYFGLKGRHPLAAPTANEGDWPEPEPVTVTRLDPNLVMARGGGRTALSSKRVLLVGCGAVGGHLAMMLASAGIGHLTLLDHDILRWENVFRHVLGKKALGRRKVEALAAELRERMPYLDVRAVPLMLDVALRVGEVNLGDFNLVVAATGEPAVDLDLNARLQAVQEPSAVFTWLEPFGVGGHALLSVGGRGCFECLYTPPVDDGTAELHNRAALYAEEQPQDFNLDEVGCGSFYTPFSDLDARRTAEVAARLVIDAMEGRVAESVIRTWKGDSRAFVDAGYVLAPRHGQNADTLLAGVPYASPRCRTCAGP